MKHVKVDIEYREGRCRPFHAEVDLSTPVTVEITDAIKNIEGVAACGEGATYLDKYSFWFDCGRAFDKYQVANNVRMALTEYFAGVISHDH